MPRPPFLVFPDHAGGFLLFQDPLAEFSGPDLVQAEALAKQTDGWLAGGLEYTLAEQPGPGWWGVFGTPHRASLDDLKAWADPSPVCVGPLHAELSFSDYQNSFDIVRQALAHGTSYQVNLTFALRGKVATGPSWRWPSALRLWLDLIATQGREASFAVLGSAETPRPILVSASPELFFSREANLVEARPMKGTALRDADPERDAALKAKLLTSPKIRAENLMVTDMLRNDLGRLAVAGGVSVPRLFEVEAYPTVWQMTSTVRAQVPEELGVAPLMAALFPCASITGAPKISTQTIISQVEAGPRGWYTGTLGWHKPASPVTGPVRSRFSVLIRTLVFDKTSELRLGVGGGVVWDSTAHDEWDEAWAKCRFVQSAQRNFSLTEAILWEPGDGFFLLEEHEERLRAACREFGGDLSGGVLLAALESEVSRSLSHGPRGPLKLRVLVDPSFALKVEAEPLSPLPEVLTVGLAPRPFTADSLLWRRFKTTNRRVYEDNRRADTDQTLHYNDQGHLTESSSMNLVLEKEGVFLTPPVSSGLLDGTFRAHLLASGKLVESVLPIAALATAEKVWLINSVRRWKPARVVSPQV